MAAVQLHHSDPVHWMRLAFTPGLSHTDRLRLLDLADGDPERAIDIDCIAAHEPVSTRLKDWLSRAQRSQFTVDLGWLDNLNCHAVGLGDRRYPALLREIADPPIVLFVEGDPGALDRTQIALVGSRKASASGLESARLFSQELASAGLGITSGLARGIDAAAHRAALGVERSTIAVMATGPDRIYPARHRQLAREIVASGALVTEFPCGAQPRPWHFVHRNRLISGLSLGVIVIEAAERSGSLITARLAGEQGRDVFALPGPIHAPCSRGCHWLIRRGAELVDAPHQVVESLGWARSVPRDSAARKNSSLPPTTVDCSREEATVLALTGTRPCSVDDLVAASGLTAGQVCSIVVALELSGLLSNQGGYFTRTTYTDPGDSHT